MKKLMAICFAFVLVICIVAVAQDAAQPATGKQDYSQASKDKSVSGKVSTDGKTIVDKDGKSWTVSNPDALKGHEGHEVTLLGDVDKAKTEVRVDSVKMADDNASEAPKK